MKSLCAFLLISITSSEAYAAGCSHQVVKDFTEGVKTSVYNTEGVLIEGRSEMDFILLGAVKLYPDIKTTVNCLAAYKVSAAFPSCADVFTKANEFSFSVRAGLISVTDTTASQSSEREAFMVSGTSAPAEVIEYYRMYPGIPSTGGYFYGVAATELLKEIVILEPGVEEDVVPVEGGYIDYFDKISEITEKCNQESGIATYKDPGLVNNRDGLAVLDVYKKSKKTCSFMVTVKNKEVRFKVPAAFRKCVEDSDAMIANIEEREDSGKLVSKKVAGGAAQFVGASLDQPVRAIASVENSEIVNSLLDGLDTGALGSLNLAANVKPSDINFLNIASLDKTTLNIVKYCEWGAAPESSDDDNAFLEEWNSGVLADAVSADNSRGGNYYWAMYFHQYQNMLFYPNLKKLHDKYKKGLITNDDLSNWSGEAYAMCLLNYPTYWNSAFLFDYILDLKLDDRTTIPSWYWNADQILK